MSNKEALTFLNESKVKYAIAYKKQNIEQINELNKEVLTVLNNMGKVPKNKQNNLKQSVLTHNLGNSKIGKDTLCINIQCGLLCPMDILNKCDNCAICYAKSQNRRHLKNTVAKNVINNTIINSVLLGEINLHTVLYNTLVDISDSYTKNELKYIKFLRINVEGDILNNEQLKIVEDIASCFKTVFNLVSCYSYTHNKELDLNLSPTVCFNTSNFKNEYYNKRTYTIDFEQLSMFILNILCGDCVLCLGDCNNCSYCKNKEDKRTVLFIKHGNGLKSVEQINSLLFAYLDYIKEVDYINFIASEKLATI